ncbi:MAG: prolyl oligopeptidase family serine peptidase, partial [Deltaproteobacteria bacterium]|nr:prolyl oligopeptidase family serine peptidase [Deltaproteobacteria bacterium]
MMKRKPFESNCDGIILRGELFLPESVDRATIVPLCHGIPREKPREGDRGYAPVAARFVEEGFGSLIFNFRGCGVSGGNFDMPGWGRDLLAVVETLSEMPFVERIVPWGFSGGAAAAVWAAAHSENIDAVALFACPAEFAAVKAVPVGSALADYFRGVGIIRDPDFPSDPEEWLNGFQSVSPEKHIGSISPRPLLIVHGTADETVP